MSLEFVSGLACSNLEAAAQRLPADAAPDESDVGLRLIARMTEDLRHTQFHDLDIIAVTVASRAAADRQP